MQTVEPRLQPELPLPYVGAKPVPTQLWMATPAPMWAALTLVKVAFAAACAWIMYVPVPSTFTFEKLTVWVLPSMNWMAS